MRGLEISGNWTLIAFRAFRDHVSSSMILMSRAHMVRGLENSGNWSLIVFRAFRGHFSSSKHHMSRALYLKYCVGWKIREIRLQNGLTIFFVEKDEIVSYRTRIVSYDTRKS